MKVDIIIPTYRPDDVFCLLLQKLQGQTFVVHRVILLNTEEKLWDEAVERFPIQDALEGLPCLYSVYHIKKEEFDHGGTRMYGARLSDADIMIFMTQDAVPKDQFLVEHLVSSLMPDEQLKEIPAVAYARQLPSEECSVVERYTRQFNYPETAQKKGKADIRRLGIKTFFCSDVCAAYRKDIFEKLGGFDVPSIFNEDMFYAAKAVESGYLIAYAADARVIHSHNYTVRQQFRRNFDLAVSQVQHPEIFTGVSSEAEGMKLVKSTVKYLCRIKKPYLIVHLGMQCVGKYAGYFMGKRYQKLSKKQILKYTMNREYWKRIWMERDD